MRAHTHSHSHTPVPHHVSLTTALSPPSPPSSFPICSYVGILDCFVYACLRNGLVRSINTFDGVSRRAGKLLLGVLLGIDVVMQMFVANFQTRMPDVLSPIARFLNGMPDREARADAERFLHTEQEAMSKRTAEQLAQVRVAHGHSFLRSFCLSKPSCMTLVLTPISPLCYSVPISVYVCE